MDNKNGKGRKPEEAVDWGKFHNAPLWDSLDEEEEQDNNKTEDNEDGS